MSRILEFTLRGLFPHKSVFPRGLAHTQPMKEKETWFSINFGRTSRADVIAEKFVRDRAELLDDPLLAERCDFGERTSGEWQQSSSARRASNELFSGYDKTYGIRVAHG
ncbi:hypothetical protein HZH68_002248 [Vespula germanica]|uniref:Uncharacterized protein n=1 Tax=Vespula germanica TaxID=30212 RepID=A0A834KZ27_VESGE|nr:hypothetical protein HZH68_002248 [Vespula germanica]